MLSVETNGGSVEARMTGKNEETKDNVEIRAQDGPKEDEKHRKQETTLYEEDEVRDGMHVNRSW